MHLLTTLGKRLWDAVAAFFAVLFGKLTPRKLTATARVKHAAALQTDLLEVASLLEKMHAWTSRMAARDSRAAKKLLDEGAGEDVHVHTPAVSGAVSPHDRKMMLRAFVTAQDFGLPAAPPPPVVAAPAAELDGDEPSEVEDEP